MNASIAYVSAPAIPSVPQPVSVWTGLRMRWQGWNGDVFSLTDYKQGIVAKPGVRGLHMPSHARYASESPAASGSRHRGHRILDRDCFWPLYIYKRSGSIDWMLWDRRFWATMDPDKPGIWTVTHPDGKERSLACRFSESDDALERDPFKHGWANYGVTLLADEPLWRGTPITRRFEPRDPRPYFSAEDPEAPAGAVLYISASGALSSARVTNDGDVPAFPVWTVVGPTTAVTVGIDGQEIVIPFEVPAGKAVRIDTDPVSGQIAWFGDWVNVVGSVEGFELQNPVDRTPELDPGSSFAQIPAGQGRQLSLSMAGTGAVIVSVTPLYRRAW